MAPFAQWLSDEISRRGWTEAEFARRGKISAQAVNQVVNEQTHPGLKFYRSTARAFEISLEEVIRIAELVPKPAIRHVNGRRVIYEANDDADILQVWHALSADDRALVRELMVRLAGRVEPRIFGEEG